MKGGKKKEKGKEKTGKLLVTPAHRVGRPGETHGGGKKRTLKTGLAARGTLLGARRGKMAAQENPTGLSFKKKKRHRRGKSWGGGRPAWTKDNGRLGEKGRWEREKQQLLSVGRFPTTKET